MKIRFQAKPQGECNSAGGKKRVGEDIIGNLRKKKGGSTLRSGRQGFRYQPSEELKRKKIGFIPGKTGGGLDGK